MVGKEVVCPSCDAIYEMQIHSSPFKDKDNFKCEDCGHLIDEWNSTSYPVYELKRRGEGQNPPTPSADHGP